MKLNNKGYMLVEIIVSSAIALVMAYFLIDITLTLVNKNNDYYVESTLLSDKNLITKELMDDLTNKDYLLTDIVVGDDAKSATLTFKDLSVSDEQTNNSFEKKLEINGNKIIYGNYSKELSSDLNVKSISVTKDANLKQLYISIPAYTNYSDIDFGINIVLPYTSEINVVMPEIKFNVELTVINGSIQNNELRITIGSNAVFEGITPNSGYSLVKESDTCNGTLDSNGKYTINNIISDKKCTLTLKEKINNLDTSGANSPDLPQGLIPVMYKEDKNTWVVADYTNTDEEYKWYDYKNKQWANAVLVTDSTRKSLSKDSEGNYIKGQEISDSRHKNSGTIAFYVWIPRYEYKVWNINKVIGTDSYNALTKGIDIIFESGTDSSGDISCTDPRESLYESCTGSNGEYYTHPAFTFGDDELRGFWMSKFEVNVSSFGIIGVGHADDGGNTSTTYYYVQSLPNIDINYGVSLSSATSDVNRMQFADETYNTYGLSTSREDTDTHVLTNMEWGAASYLTYSEYGRCKNKVCEKVSQNSYMEYITGMGNSDDSYIKDEYTYSGSEGMKASTTGNIYGIYDMYGGLEEWTMGTVLKDSTSYEYDKYLVKYANGNTSTDQSAYDRGKLGDATSEVVMEIEDEDCILFCAGLSQYANFPVNTYYSDPYGYPYFVRGGSIHSTVDAFGIFYFNYAKGIGNASDSNGYSFRVSLVSLK